MKKIIALLLALAMCVSLCACGKSEAVTNVEGLIDAIGEVTAESESAITAAEEAYNALTEEEKAEVENREILETVWIKYYDACLISEWMMIGSEEAAFSFYEDGKVVFMGVEGKWEKLGNRVSADFNEYNLKYEFDMTTIDGVVVLASIEWGSLIRAEDYQKVYDEMFVEVELTSENINEYIEILPYEIEYKDAFGDGTGEYDCGAATSSKVFNDGLVYWSSKDVGIEIIIPNDYYEKLGEEAWNWSVYSSGSQANGWVQGNTVVDTVFGAVIYGFGHEQYVESMLDFQTERLSFGRAKGTITFVREENVESISNVGCRTVVLKNGMTAITGYWCNGVDWPDNILS